ncbi:MAG: PLP-dependent aminotransferase family protein [Eubacteriales bacterium]
MKYKIDGSMKKPAYIQLYEQLRRDITDGLYPAGARLPSKRVTAEDCGVSVITAEHAYALLCDEGYAEARRRSGYFSCYKAADSFPVARSVPHQMVMSDAARPADEFPFSVLSRTMRRVITEYGSHLLEKPPSSGCRELREQLSRYLARSRGIEAPPESIIIGAGAEYLYGLVAQLFAGSIFAVEDPSYEKIHKVYMASGAKCEFLRLCGDGIDSGALASSSASVLHITPYHSFPSGVTASASKRREYVEWARRRGGYIVEDDYASEFTPSRKPEDTVYSLEGGGRTIYINTFSKTVSPGMRMGYMLLPPSLSEEFGRSLGFYSCTVPEFEQYVLAELLASGDFERHLNRVRRSMRRNGGQGIR